MSKSDVIEVEGIVTEAYPNAAFEVQLENGHKVLAQFIKEQKKYCNSYQRQIKYTSMQSFYFSMHAVGFVRLPRKNSYTQEVRK